MAVNHRRLQHHFKIAMLPALGRKFFHIFHLPLTGNKLAS